MRIWPWIALSALCAISQPVAARPADAPRTVTMSGHGEVRAVPDTALLSAGVSTQAATAAAALSANSARMRTVLAALKKQAIPEKDVQTANLSVSPQYASDVDQAPRITGYQANNQVEVQLEDVSKLGVVLDALAAAGANRMNGVRFLIRDDADLLAKARADAVTDARTKAEAFAKAAGVSLGPILSINEAGGAVLRPMLAAASMMARARAVPVALGEQSIGANVTIVWAIQ